MEYTKESLFGTCIHCKSKKTFLKALEFYKQVGYEPLPNYKDIEFEVLKKEDRLYVIQMGYGILYFDKPLQRKVIKLPRKRPLAFPRIMLVSDDEKLWRPRMVYCKMPKPFRREFVANKYSPKSNRAESIMSLRAWKFAKEYLNPDKLMTEGTKAIW